jgi:hypothetical protein
MPVFLTSGIVAPFISWFSALTSQTIFNLNINSVGPSHYEKVGRTRMASPSQKDKPSLERIYK